MSAFKPNTEGVFFDLPAKDYHEAPGVSQSTLKAFDDAGSPLHFRALKRKAATPDMQFGTLVHAAVLEPGTFNGLFHIQPEHYETVANVCPTCKSVSDAAKCRKCGVAREQSTIKKEWNGNSDVCREWLAKHSDRIVLDAPTHGRVVDAATALVKNAGLFSTALFSKHAQREVSYFKRDEGTGLLLKARVDLQVVDKNGETVLFDPKKVGVGCGNEIEFQKQVKDFGYHIQAASYLDITGAAELYFVPFDDDAPFECNIWSLHSQWLELGKLEYRRMLRAYAECVKSGNWPGYHRDGRELKMPDWLKKRVKELNAAETNAFLQRVPVAEGGAA